MKLLRTKFIIVLLAIFMTSGVYAMWTFYASPQEKTSNLAVGLSAFKYPPFYITDIQAVAGDYASASAKKTDDTNMQADVTLNATADSVAIFEVTFYNGSEVSYYYNETQTLNSDNSGITYVISNVDQKEEVPSKSYKKLTVAYKFKNGVTTDKSVVSELHFSFVVDKDSIGILVAQTAVTQFSEILNTETTYKTLEDHMNSRGSNSSSVSYVGNVAGANDDDSRLVQELFTNEFLTMDLDGDGKAEPITLMIKREDLDDDTTTGDSYTYKSFLGNKTVQGVEFTLYITSEGFEKNTLVVYAVTYTKFQGSDEWVEVVPLTKGTATANKYSFSLFGDNNSFNTDTWKSDDGKTMGTLAKSAIQSMKK